MSSVPSRIKVRVRTAALLLFGLLHFFISANDLLASAPLSACGTPTTRYDWNRDTRITANGNEGYENFKQRAQRANCTKDWTLLIFMAADNDLEPYALKDLYELEAGYESGRMAAASSTVKADVVVQLDTRGRDGFRRLHLFQTDTVFQAGLTQDAFVGRSTAQVRSPIVEIVPELDSTGQALTREKQLEDFLRWGVRNYPSKRLMVIVWGHGQGWGTRSKTNPRGGIALGEAGASRLSIPALRRVLEKISKSERSGNPIDVYASDACLMQMTEVADEIADTSKYIIGSAQVQSFEGLPYRRILYELNTGRWNGERSATGGLAPGNDWQEPWWMARMIPDLMNASLQSRGSQGKSDPNAKSTLTLASIETSSLKTRVAPALNHLGAALISWSIEDPMRKLSVLGLLPDTLRFEGGALELGSFLLQLELAIRQERDINPESANTRSTLQLTAALEETRDALRMAVVNRVIGPGYFSQIDERVWISHLQSLSIWIPADASELATRKPEFSQSRLWHEAPHWAEWISSLYPQ